MEKAWALRRATDFKVVSVIQRPGMPDYSEIFQRMGGSFFGQECRTEKELVQVAHDADFIITHTRSRPIGADVIHGLENCKAILGIGIGYDGVDVEAATRHGICVVNNPDYCLQEVSDHAMALILACSRGIVQFDNTVRSRPTGSDVVFSQEVKKLYYKVDTLRGKTLGIIGFGRTSRRLAPKALALGMKLIAFDPHVKNDDAANWKVELVGLTDLLSESDFVLVQAALNPETRHLLSADQFKIMKPSAFLINTARGAIVDENALYTALAGGLIAGAGLDVTEIEPLQPNSPLIALDNVILTGHSAHASKTSWAKLWYNPVEQIARVLRGEWPTGLVNPEVKENFAERWGKMR
ncbi:MAG: C-terminal binding protein [Pseudomonadota bacterium]